ncbi:MAG TPA: hypothetical protein VF186_00740 [Gaiellaceae bacterium]|jgi:hypothetical protein
MTHRRPDQTAPRRPKPSRPRYDVITEEANLVRESWEKLLRVRPL